MTTRLIVAYVRRHVGDPAIGRLLELAGDDRPLAVLEDERSWSTYEQKIALFAAAATLTGDESVACRIGASLLEEQLAAVLRAVIGALGSPQRVLRSVTRANVKFSTSATMHAVEVGRGSATISYRLHEGFVPSRHDCLYTRGILSQATVLFGLPPAGITHRSCQVEGAEACVYELRWRSWRWWGRGGGRQRARPVDATLQERVRDLELTVADLVAAEDLEGSLERIANRAAAAVHAQRHLLAVQVGDRRFVHGDGLDPVTAEPLAHRLLASGDIAVEGFVVLAAPIVSPRNTYGWLAAFLPAGTGFLPGEQEHLEAYAGLAAAMLDVATSLQEARRSGQISAALITLGRQLAQEADVEAVATRVAEAVPLVVGSVRASVLLWDPARGCLTTVAAVGYGELLAEAMAFEVRPDATPQLERLFSEPVFRRLERGTDDAFIDASLARFGDRAVSIAPIRAADEFIGVVVANHPGGHLGLDEVAVRTDALVGLADQAGLAIGRLGLLRAARHAATHDHLTGLADRALFDDRVHRALADGRRTGRRAAVCFLDLDRFKRVNDSHGHAAGDALLVEVADRIRRALRETDSVARIAGDEFAVLLRDLDDPSVAAGVADTLATAITAPYTVDGRPLHVGVSIGIAIAPDHGSTPAELLKAADAAMYRAKQRGRACEIAEATPAMR